jgi:hypothetical protein
MGLWRRESSKHAALRSAVPVIPPVYTKLAAFWGLNADEARRVWSALKQAQAPPAVAFRQYLVFYDDNRAYRSEAQHMLHTICAPKRLLAILEGLQEEGLLSRRETTAVEERIFQAVDAHGRWCDHRVQR